MSYRPPQFTIQQEFAAIPSAIVEPLQPCIVGPSKRVFEYTDTDDKAVISYGAYDPTVDNTFDYAGLFAGAVVDETSVQLIVEEIWARYAVFTGSDCIRGDAANIVVLASDAFKESDAADRHADLENRDVAVGDRVRVVNGVLTLDTRVTALRATPVAASAGSFSNGDSNPATVGASAAVTVVTPSGSPAHTATSSAAAFVGGLDEGFMTDTYTVTCTTAGVGAAAVFSVTSTHGDNLTGVAGVAFASPMTVGTKGLTLTISQNGGSASYTIGEKYSIAAVAAYTRVVPVITGSSDVDYEGDIDTIYTVKVVRGGDWDLDTIQVSVTTNNGIDYAPAITVLENASFNLGTLGVTMKFPNNVTQDGLLLNDTYLVALTAASDGVINQLVLADALDSSISESEEVDVSLYIYKASMEIPVADYPSFGSVALSTTDSDFTVESGLEIFDSTWVDDDGEPVAIPVIKGNIFVPYSAILTVGAGDFNTLSELSSVETVLGKPIPSNPLSYGVYKALENSNGQPVNYVSVSTDDLSGYESALVSLEQHEQAYFVVPLTDNLEIANLYKAHVLAMSDKTHQFERMLFISRPLSTTLIKYGAAPGGGQWTGYIAQEPGSSPAVYNQLHMEDADFLIDGIRAGDTVRFNFAVDGFGVETYDSATVGTVTDGQNLVLASPGIDAAYASAGSPLRINILRNLTKTEQSESIASASSSFNDRRVVNVWPDLSIDDASREVAGHFLACAIAGLKSSVAPHQGITHYTLTGWSSMDRSFKYFTPTQLNTIAAGGTFIISQDSAAGPIFVRHQLTTDQTDANHGQLSVTTNLDAICKFMRGDLKDFIGKYNSGEHFIKIADAMIRQKISYLMTQTITPTAGAQITSFDPNSLSVIQDPLIRTTVTARAKIGLPYPLDNFDLVLEVV